MATPIRIPVTAAADASWDRVFGSIEKSAKRARKAIDSESAGAATDLAKNVKSGADKAEAAYAKMVAELEGKGGKMMDAGTTAVKEFVTETKSNFEQAKSSFNEVAKDAEKAMARVKKANESAAKGEGGYTGKQFGSDARNAGSRLAGYGMRAARFGMSVADDLAQGAGVDTSFGSIVRKNNSLEDTAVGLSNAGVIASDPRNSKRVDPAALIQQARDVGASTGQDAGDVLGGLRTYAGITGDLKTGRDTMYELAKLSKATGTNFEDMMSAAAGVSGTLGDIPNKGEALVQVMTKAASQGKMGSLELKDMADHMGRLSASAGQYGGDAKSNIAMNVAMAQMAKFGGADTSSSQTQSVAAFTASFGKGARLDAFKKYGVETQDKDHPGMLRSPEQIILDALKATGGDRKKMGEMFASSAAQRVTNSALLTYNQAGQGDAGLEAVRKQMETLATATMSAEEVNRSFAAAMNTNTAKANAFNIELSKNVDAMQSSLYPALIALGPMLLSGAKDFSRFVAKITGGPDPDAAAAQAALGDSTTGMLGAKVGLLNKQASLAPGETLAGTMTDAEKDKALRDLDAAQKGTDAQQKVADDAANGRVGTAGMLARGAADQILSVPEWLLGNSGALANQGMEANQTADQTKFMADTMKVQLDNLTEVMTNGGLNVNVKTLPAGGLSVNPSGIVPASQPTHQ